MQETSLRDEGWPELVRRFRWAFEPALGLVLIGFWAALTLGNGRDDGLSTILLLAAAVGLSRILPSGALSAGVLSLLAAADSSSSSDSLVWAFCVAGGIVFFGATAYGSRGARWVGLAGAILLFLIQTAIGLFSILDVLSGGGLLTAHGTAGLLAEVGLRLASVQVGGAVLIGGWAAGLVLRARADHAKIMAHASADSGAAIGGRPRHPDVLQADRAARFESWLMNHGGEDSPVSFPPSRLIQAVTVRQLAADGSIALLFALVFVTTDSRSLPTLVLVFGFSLTLSLRRLAPAAALGVAWLTAIIQIAAGLNIVGANIAILAVLYATAAYGGRALRLAGLISVGVGALIAAVYLAVLNTFGTTFAWITPADIGLSELGAVATQIVLFFVASLGVLGLSWTLGLLMRTWQNARQSRRQEVRALEEQRTAERAIVVEQERNRIARDMHDVVAHSLAVVIAQADGARYARATDPDAVDTALSTIAQTAREALADVRVLLTQLRQQEASGPQPVLDDLDRLIEQMRGAGLALVWTNTGTPVTLGSGAQLAAYRIIQEALTNALRHGDPDSRVHLTLQWAPGMLTAIVDNAVRSGPTSANSAGHGLPGMRERATLAGGTLATELRNGRFRVSATLPAGVGPGPAGVAAAPAAPITAPIHPIPEVETA